MAAARGRIRRGVSGKPHDPAILCQLIEQRSGVPGDRPRQISHEIHASRPRVCRSPTGCALRAGASARLTPGDCSPLVMSRCMRRRPWPAKPSRRCMVQRLSQMIRSPTCHLWVQLNSSRGGRGPRARSRAPRSASSAQRRDVSRPKRRPRNSALRPVSGWVRTIGWIAPGRSRGIVAPRDRDSRAGAGRSSRGSPGASGTDPGPARAGRPATPRTPGTC